MALIAEQFQSCCRQSYSPCIWQETAEQWHCCSQFGGCVLDSRILSIVSLLLICHENVKLLSGNIHTTTVELTEHGQYHNFGHQKTDCGYRHDIVISLGDTSLSYFLIFQYDCKSLTNFWVCSVFGSGIYQVIFVMTSRDFPHTDKCCFCACSAMRVFCSIVKFSPWIHFSVIRHCFTFAAGGRIRMWIRL